MSEQGNQVAKAAAYHRRWGGHRSGTRAPLRSTDRCGNSSKYRPLCPQGAGADQSMGQGHQVGGGGSVGPQTRKREEL